MAREFKFEWRISLTVLFLLPTLIGLGFWQLHRADHNRALLLQAEQQRKAAPVILSEFLQNNFTDMLQENLAAWHLKPVKLRGYWLNKVFLLENQISNEHNGYYIYGVMQLNGNQGLLLVNRGWLPAPALRSQLPSVPAVTTGEVEEVGEIYESPALHDNKPLFAEQGWPKRIGRINLSGAEQELQTKLLPVVVRLTSGSPSALATQWTVVNIMPEKNTAYAIQWFAMAIALVLCYGFYSFRK